MRVATETIQRVFRDIGVPHLVKTQRRRPKQLKLFEKERPGDSVQVDVKVVVRGRDVDAAGEALAAWERRYNHERFSMALQGRTPMEKLTTMLTPPVVMARAPDSVQDRATPSSPAKEGARSERVSGTMAVRPGLDLD